MSQISQNLFCWDGLFRRRCACALARPGFQSARRASAALEFAILSVPFMLFLLFLFEVGFDLYAQLALDYAVQEGARELQTGAGNAATSVAAFKTNCLCPTIAPFLNCDQITLNVVPMTGTDYYTNATAGAGSIPLAAGALSMGGFAFVPSGAGTPMFMQAIYTSASVVGLLLPSMSVQYQSSRVHVTSSSIGFVNEPFPTSNTVCGASQ